CSRAPFPTTQTASASVTKTVDLSSISAPGTLSYEIKVVNTGNVSLTNASVTDVVAQDGVSTTLSVGTPVQTGGDAANNNNNIIEVGETWTYTITYGALQSHIDNGGDIVNTFTFSADELGAPVSDDATTTITQSASASVTKTVDLSAISAPGTLSYEIKVANTGNVSLTGTSVTDAVVQDGVSTTLSVGTPVQTGGDASNNNNNILRAEERRAD